MYLAFQVCLITLVVSIVLQFQAKFNILDSIVVSIPACHAGDRGSIPRRGEVLISRICLLKIDEHSLYIMIG